MATMKRAALALALVSFVLLCSTLLWAKPSYKDQQRARHLVQEAKALVKQGKADQAEAKLSEADSLDPKTSTKYQLASAMIEQGRLLDAADVLDAAKAGKAVGWREKKAKDKVEELSEELVERTPTLTVVIVEPKDVEVAVKLDGQPFDVAAGPHPLDPGTYEIVATAPGYAEDVSEVPLAERAQETVSITLAPAGEAADEDADSDGTGLDKWPAIVAWGVGGAALAVGTIFGIMAVDQTNTLYDKYDCSKDTCPEDAREDLDMALLNGDVSTVGFVIAGVGLAAGTVLWLLSDSDEDEGEIEGESGDEGEEARVRVVPLLGPGFVGLQGAF